jgi:hypothetical protein
MKRVKTHLIACSGTTRVVVFLCDTWDARRFQDDHFADLSAHHYH